MYFKRNIVLYRKKYNGKNDFFEMNISIICRLIHFNNDSIFAEEVSTKKLFPIVIINDNDNYIVKSNDRIISATYYIKFNTSDDLERIYLNDILSEKEVQRYINNSSHSFMHNIESFANNNLIDDEINYFRVNGKYRYISKENISFLKEIVNFDSEDIKELQKYGFDLSSINTDSFIGRDREIKEIIKSIAIKKKSVILVGESGCGKTAIVNDIAKNHMDRFLKGKKIFYISPLSLISDTKYRGTFEGKINNIIKICEKYNGNIILFFDEIHTLNTLGTDSENRSNDAMNMLKPYIENGKIIIIGATTIEEYNKYIKVDSAFARRLEKVDISNLNNDELLIILFTYINDLESRYNIELDLDDEEMVLVLKELLRITDKNRQKAIDNIKILNPTISKSILEDAFVEAIYNENKFVTIDDIYYAISNHSNLSDNLCEEMRSRLNGKIRTDITKRRIKKNIIDINKYSLV